MDWAVRWMLHQERSMAWKRWQAEAGRMCRQEAEVRMAVGQMLHQALLMAWQMWHAEAGKMRR